MANSSINFNPAKFVGGVTKSFVTATSQVVSSYMPFTSDMISETSSAVTDVKDFIVSNRPDRKSKNKNNVLKTVVNGTIQASKSLIEDISHGDLNFNGSRDKINSYLSEYDDDGFDFGLDDDDFSLDGDESDNSEVIEKKNFTSDDFAKGIHASTSAIIDASEVAYRNIALSNAKSNTILGDRLIANSLSNMSQIIEMSNTTNKNLSSINMNLTSLVQYNNTTMNDFIKNTMIHFNKMERFMDTVVSKITVDDKKSRSSSGMDMIFNGDGVINFKNLFNATVDALEWSQFGGVVDFVRGLVNDEGKMDLSLIKDAIANLKPLNILIDNLVPELKRLSSLDETFKTAFGNLRYNITRTKSNGGWLDDDSFLSDIIASITDYGRSYIKSNNDKRANWMKSDSSALQLLPTIAMETNDYIESMHNNVESIVDILNNMNKRFAELPTLINGSVSNVETVHREPTHGTGRNLVFHEGTLKSKTTVQDKFLRQTARSYTSGAADITNLIIDYVPEGDMDAINKFNEGYRELIRDLFLTNDLNLIDDDGNIKAAEVFDILDDIYKSAFGHSFPDEFKHKFVALIPKIEDARREAVTKNAQTFNDEAIFKYILNQFDNSLTTFSLLDSSNLDFSDFDWDDKLNNVLKNYKIRDWKSLKRQGIIQQITDAPEGSEEYEAHRAEIERRIQLDEFAERRKRMQKDMFAPLTKHAANYGMYSLATTLEDTIHDVLSGNGFSFDEFLESLRSNYDQRKAMAQVAFDSDGKPIDQMYYSKDPSKFGMVHIIDKNGIDHGWTYAADFEDIRDRNLQNGYELRGKKFVKDITNPDGTITVEESDEQWTPKYETGAMRIDKDKLVQVHEGEMILDKALSENVREQFAKVLKNGGFDGMSEAERKQLISAIEASNDAFKDRGEQTLNDILNETRKHDLNGKVDLSDESVCIIPINKDDSPASVIMKTLSEMATNTRIMLAGAIGSAFAKDAENASGNVKSGFSKLFGSYDKDTKKLKGGAFTESANKFIDDMQYWAFKNIGGFSYTGTMRDEYGNKFEGDKQYFKNGEDNPETISKRFIGMITERAEIAMDQMGLSSDEKNKYIGSIKNLIGGTKGAGKGWIAGLAATGFLGLSAVPALGFLVPAIGALTGFGLSNKDNSNLIFGAEATDSDGRKYRYGGLFSGFINKFAELGDDVKTNFKTTFAEIGKNLRDATTVFMDNLIHKDRQTLLDKITTGIKDAVFGVTAKATEVAVDAANIGVRIALNAAKIPFNAIAGVIGGKEFRKQRRHEKWIERDNNVKAALKEYAMYERLIGGNVGNAIAGITEFRLNVDNKIRSNAAVIGGLASTAFSNAKNRFSDWVTNQKNEDSNMITELKNIMLEIKSQQGSGLQAILGIIPAAIAAFTGHPFIAAALAGFDFGNFVLKNRTGAGAVAFITKAVQLMGTGVGRKAKEASQHIGAGVHKLKRLLGFKDNKFDLKMATKSTYVDDASMLGDLGFSEEDQDAYFKFMDAMNKGIDPNSSQEDLDKFSSINESLRSGLSTKNREEKEKLTADEKRYKELSKKKDLTEDERKELAQLKLGKMDRRRRLSDLTQKGKLFQKSHNYDENNFTDRVKTLAGNWDALKASATFKNDLFSPLTREMFPNKTDEEFADIVRTYNAQRSKVGKNIIGKYGTGDEFIKNIDDVKGILMKQFGLNESAFEGKSVEDIKKFVLGNNYTDSAISKGEELEQKFKDRITGENDSIFSFVKQTKEDLKNMLELFKTWINTEKKEEPIGEEAPELVTSDEEVLADKNQYNKLHWNRTLNGDDGNTVEAFTNNDTNPIEQYEDKICSSVVGNIVGRQFKDGKYHVISKDGDAYSDQIVNGVSQLTFGENALEIPAHAEGVLNVNKTGPAMIHAGEAVLDAETAKSFRSGAFGGGGILADTMASIKNGIGDLVSVFKGDEHGNADAKKSFLDKMKESFSGVGKTITGAVFGSGLIPLDPLTGQPDIAKIGARLIALLGGVLVLGPIIGKVAQALKPIFEPLIEGIKTAVTSAVATVKDVIYDMAGVNSFDELIMKMGAYIHEGWKKIGEYKASQSINKSDTEFKNDKTVEHNYANRKSIEGNIKSSGSDMNFAQYSEFCNGCQRYYEAIKEFGKFVAKESSEIQGNTISKVTAMGGATGYVLGLVSTATAKFNKTTGILSKAIESQLTSSEKSFITNHVTRNSEFFLGALTGNFYAFEGTLMSDFCQVITSETGIGVKYEDNAYIADTKVSAAKIQRGIEIINTRIGILNKLRNSGGASTNYFADQFKSQVAARNSEINATVPAPTTSGGGNSEEKPAGDGIGYGYTQNDPRWSSMGYGRFKSGRASTMGSGGCGPTAMSNVYTQLTGRTINPAQMARFSQANGYNAQGGTSAGLFTSGARKLGLSSRAIGKNGSAIGKSVMNGNGVIIAGKNGPYTRAGHIMSVRGVDGFGNAIVDDPLRRGARRIPMNKLTKGMTHAWSIGNGEGTGAAGQPHSYWDNEFTDGTISFNPNGGAFGYTDALSVGCVYNSFVNAYLNSLLADGQSFTELAKTISPLKLSQLYPGIVSSGGGLYRDKVYNALNDYFKDKAMGRPEFDYYEQTEGSPEVYNLIYENLKAGNPIVFGSLSGTSTKMREIISGNADEIRSNPEHTVLLAGIYTDSDGNEFVVVDNNNTGRARKNDASKSNQIRKVPLDYFRNAITTATGYDIRRIGIFNRNGVRKGVNLEDKFNNLRKASLDKNNPNSNKYREEFINTFGFEPEKYNSYQDYIKSTSPTQSGTNGTYSGLTSTGSPDLFTNGLSSNASGSNVTSIGNWQIPADLLEHRSHTNFVEYIADIAGRLAQLGSNILGSLISGGDTSGLTKGPSGGVGFAGGTHGGGGGGGVLNASASITGTPIDSAGQSIDGYTAPMSSLATYNALPDWAKTGLNEVKFHGNPGIPDFENAINYSATVTPIGETGVQFPPKNYSQLEKMYFHIYNDNGLPSFGRSGFHFGRNGGYPGDAVFTKLMNHPDPNVATDATNYYNYVKNNLSNFSNSGETITGSKEFLNALIQAEDAANIELKSYYFKQIHKANSGITDPRIYSLGGDVLCINPSKSTLLSGVNDLDSARSRLHGVANWAGSRVDGVYGLLTSGTGKINGTTWSMPPYSIGSGDAGYAMRDNSYRYTDDIYMGDADHPMNVTMDNTPVTTRLDKLIYLLDSAVNYNETPKSGPSNAKPLGNGDGDKAVKKQQPSRSSKGETSVGAHDRLASIHNKIAKRTRVGLNYNQL